jgi:hypothetical protein
MLECKRTERDDRAEERTPAHSEENWHERCCRILLQDGGNEF